jgi:hypothetical protein
MAMRDGGTEFLDGAGNYPSSNGHAQMGQHTPLPSTTISLNVSSR